MLGSISSGIGPDDAASTSRRSPTSRAGAASSSSTAAASSPSSRPTTAGSQPSGVPVPGAVGRGRPVRAGRGRPALRARDRRRPRAGAPGYRALRLRGRAGDGRAGARNLPRRGGAALMHVRELARARPSCSCTPAPGSTARSSCRASSGSPRATGCCSPTCPATATRRTGDRDEWTLAGFARAVERLAIELELEDWTLLGHSFGGYVALQHLVDFPGSASRDHRLLHRRERVAAARRSRRIRSRG